MCKYIGYIRVSTSEKSAKQDYERQRYLFEKSGLPIEKIYEEHISGGVKGNQREQFNAMLETLDSDTMVVLTESSRFGRNYIDCFEMLDLITQGRKAGVIFLSNGIELKGGEKMNPYTWLTISNFFIMDEFLKRQIGYNTKNALKAKKENGVRLGRKCDFGVEIYDDVIRLKDSGMSYQEVADELGISKSSVVSIYKREKSEERI